MLCANQVDNEASLNTLVNIAVNVVVLQIFTSQTIIFNFFQLKGRCRYHVTQYSRCNLSVTKHRSCFYILT